MPQAAAQTKAPAPPPSPGAATTAPGTSANGIVLGAPTSLSEMRAIRARRDELSSQLQNVQGRRRDVARELRNATANEAPGVQARLNQLDTRILQIEQDLAVTGQQISSAPAGLLSATASTPPPDQFLSPVQVTAISIVSVVTVGLPLAIAAAIRWIRRGKVSQVGMGPELGGRLDNLERGMEAIAIEVERISEGQRFTTKLLSERARQLEPERIPRDG